MSALIADLMSLFAGYKDVHGIYYVKGASPDNSGKIVGKAATIKETLSVELWQKHLDGQQGLGVIPIREDSKVKFAAIDIDKYPLDLIGLSEKIQELKLPLVLCRTKSGGAHLFLFLKDWEDAGVVQRKLREYAMMMGYGDSEVFPKQIKIVAERGDIGQWINMPYFDVHKTLRYAVGDRGQKLEVLEFIEYAKSKAVSPEDLDKTGVDKQEILPGGPPCLNYLVKVGFPEGTRNNGLFNLGVYARKANRDKWKYLLEDFNTRFMDPPLPSSEVLGVIKSLEKKEFAYMCSQPPIKQFCDNTKCKKCEFGIRGGGVGMPVFGSLTKIEANPPVWFLEVEGGGRLELATEDLHNPRRFQLRCMESLNILPQLTKLEVWTDMIQRLLADVTVVSVPKESTPVGILLLHLEEFCTSRVQGKTHDELLLGKPWTNNGYHYFRLKDFLAYLDRQKFNMMKLNQIAVHIQEIKGCEKKFFNIRGKGANCYMIPEFKKQTESFETPAQNREVAM